ncbi:small subunit mRNA capping enzyme [Pteropox virus]|uniref:Small subunit mRNA capping enzyme n=1 Tax=Pteropox virus TaxID=1873698 RepID=A0A1B1MRD2_9POXV|nr:small subunit mRNA capping enzyme [Pteropox virus]ANS71176.1 small subunit mRNA capping enzyme [Pteropox virus]
MDTIESVKAQIRDGVSARMPFYENLPNIHLTLGVMQLPSLQYGTNYFLQLSKVNDLNRLPTELLSLFTHDVMIPETDIDQICKTLKIKSVKTHSKGIKAEAIVVDMSAKNKLYKRDRGLIKSNNFLTENNLYISDYKLITFELFRPLFDYTSEKYVIIKLPTMFGRTIVDAMRVYCSLFKTVRLFKCANDSWLKDSFVIVCEDPHVKNIHTVLTHFKNVTKSSTWKESNNVPFMILKDPVDGEFIDIFLNFSTKVYKALYVAHSLLFESMTSDSKSLENDSQRKLVKLLM